MSINDRLSIEELEKKITITANEAAAAEAAVNAVAKVLAAKQAVMIKSFEHHNAVSVALRKAKKVRRQGD